MIVRLPTRVVGALIVACLLSLDPGHAAESDKADVVLRNGKVYTADKERSVKQAIAFTANTIVAVGADADMERLIGPDTKVVDLKGKLVLPGMFDTHIHPIIGAMDQAKFVVCCSSSRPTTARPRTIAARIGTISVVISAAGPKPTPNSL